MTTVIRKIIGIAVLALSACSNEHAREEKPAKVYTPRAQPRPATMSAVPDSAATAADWNSLQLAIQARVDSVDRKLRRVPNLTLAEKTRLRRDVNAIQIERARQLGVRATTSVEPLVRSGKLVRLADSTEYWVVRELDFSVPYVTPSAEAMLTEIGRRFQAQLDSLSIPRFRLDITSVLRTPEKQAALRQANSNASRIESAHEFGTTVDVAYRRFAAPLADSALAGPALEFQARTLSDSLMIETARKRGGELQAVLGRVLAAMQAEGKLMVRMEKRQTVYHMTVARPLPPVKRTAL